MTKCLTRFATDDEGVIDSSGDAHPDHVMRRALEAAINAVGVKGAVVACELGMSQAYFSDIRTGKRSVPIARILPWVKRYPAAGLAFAEVLIDYLEVGGFAKARAVRTIRAMSRMRKELARDFGADDSMVRAFEDSGEFRVDGDAA